MPEAAKKRPEFRNIHVTQLAKYRLPIAGVVSILHRVSGTIMFLLLPFILYLLDNSLTSEDTFNYFAGYTQHLPVKFAILVLAWAYLHHFCAGIRHLLMDLHMGLDKHSAKKSGATVLAVSLTLAFLVALKLFGVF